MGKVAMTDLNFSRYVDKASPKLFEAAYSGKSNTIKLIQTKSETSDNDEPYMEFTFKNAVISHYAVKGLNTPGISPREELTLSFTALEISCISYKDDGSVDASSALSFDTTTNTATTTTKL